MIVTEITNHVQQALARLLQQYQGQPRITALMTALVNQIQAIENAFYPLDAGRQLANAQGMQLDNLGTIVGIARNGLSDAEYLIFILGTIAENNSTGTDASITAIVKQLFAVSAGIILELFPAEVAIQIPNSTTLSATLYATVTNIIQNALGAGIGLGFISVYPASAFQVGTINNTNVGGGFGGVGQSGGGGFASNIYSTSTGA